MFFRGFAQQVLLISNVSAYTFPRYCAKYATAHQICMICQLLKSLSMLTLCKIFAASFVLGLSGALMPGPLLTVTIGEAARKGFIAGPLLVLGHALLELALVICFFFGFGAYLAKPGIFATVAIIGSFLLLWMAFGMLRGWRELTIEFTGNSPACKYPVLYGSLVSISNPYFLLWWATVGIGYIAVAQQSGWWGVAFFYVGHILSDFFWYSLVALGVTMGRRFISNGIYQGIVVVCAVFLIMFACYFGYSGIKGII
jgi:threonine/homoserine/homoserine lactone efflux protein